VRFSQDSNIGSEANFSRWPGVYVHPGNFVHAADRPKDEEAWQRCRNSFRRLKARVRKKRAERTDPHGKRR